MNIIILVNSLEKGGRTKRILDESKILTECGHHVFLVAFSEPPEWVKKTFILPSDFYVLVKRPKLDLMLVFKLVEIIHRNKIDIIHAHCEGSILYGGLAGFILRKKVIATYHRSELKYYQPTFKNSVITKFLDHCIAISSERKVRIKKLGIKDKDISIVHGGIDLRDLGQVKNTYDLEKNFNLDGRVIFSAGHLGEIKGHDDSIVAVSKIIKKFPNIRLYIAGDGSGIDFSRLNNLVNQYNLTENVFLLGQITNSLEWILKCEFFLQPSREEGFGLVFLEAGICGKACIATNVGGIPDIIISEETGILVNPESPDDIANALERLLMDGALTKALGDKAKERVCSKFLIQSAINNQVDIYRKVLN